MFWDSIIFIWTSCLRSTVLPISHLQKMTTTLSMMGKITDKDYDIQITSIVNLLNSPK